MQRLVELLCAFLALANVTALASLPILGALALLKYIFL